MQAAQNQHNVKMGKHHSDHQAAEVLKAGQARLDRHSGVEHSRQVPKKEGGGGKGTWGSVQDDIKEALHDR